MMLQYYPVRRLDDFRKGQACQFPFSLSTADLSAFTIASGDTHPLHTDLQFAIQRGYPGVLLHGMCIASRCSNYITREFVGRNGLLVSLTLDFRHPVFVDDNLCFFAKVNHVDKSACTVEVNWHVVDSAGTLVQRGTACSWIGAD